ncbi:MAG: hypothetical protein IPM01_29620 [Burkholderiaceae bacterium]|nr:hypothetical protein [Burkholderiaceae bacterium]
MSRHRRLWLAGGLLGAGSLARQFAAPLVRLLAAPFLRPLAARLARPGAAPIASLAPIPGARAADSNGPGHPGAPLPLCCPGGG